MTVTFLNSGVVDCKPLQYQTWLEILHLHATYLGAVRSSVATFSEFCKEFHREVNLLHGCQEVWISCGEIAPLCFTFLHRHQQLNQQKWGFWPGNVSIFFKLWTSHVKLLPTIFQVLLEMKKSSEFPLRADCLNNKKHELKVVKLLKAAFVSVSSFKAKRIVWGRHKIRSEHLVAQSRLIEPCRGEEGDWIEWWVE